MNSTESQESEALWNCFFIDGKRHDRDRAEIQFGFDGHLPVDQSKFKYQVDLLIMSPKSLGFLEHEDPKHIKNDFQSYLRLHTATINSKNKFSEAHVIDSLNALKIKTNSETMRLFSLELEAYLKSKTNQYTKTLKRDRSVKFSNVFKELESFYSILSAFRDFDIQFRKSADPKSQAKLLESFDFLDEYISHLYVQCLVNIHLLVEREDKISSEKLKQYIDSEYQYRKTKSFFILDASHKAKNPEEEKYIRRISLLKKYFQRDLFVTSEDTSIEKRMLIPVYAVSAALAASFAISVQLYQSDSSAQKLGINTVAFITIAVIAYVIKDIAKDSFRKFFLKSSRKHFSDFKKKLFYKPLSRKIHIGHIQEYIEFGVEDKLSDSFKGIRYGVPEGDLEEKLSEEILHYQKVVILKHKKLDFGAPNNPWGLREILRIKLDDLTTSMEDRYKRALFLDSNKEPVEKRSHKIYNIYIAAFVSATGSANPTVKNAFKLFKLKLDKKGIISCESIKQDAIQLKSIFK